MGSETSPHVAICGHRQAQQGAAKRPVMAEGPQDRMLWISEHRVSWPQQRGLPLPANRHTRSPQATRSQSRPSGSCDGCLGRPGRGQMDQHRAHDDARPSGCSRVSARQRIAHHCAHRHGCGHTSTTDHAGLQAPSRAPEARSSSSLGGDGEWTWESRRRGRDPHRAGYVATASV